MTDSKDKNQIVKLIKHGKSYDFLISEHDRKILKADEKTKFKQIISPDGTKITFKKI